MSRIGKKVIKLPAGVKVSTKDNHVHVEGPKGKLDGIVPAGVEVKVVGQEVTMVLKSTERAAGAPRLGPLAAREHGRRRDQHVFEDPRD